MISAQQYQQAVNRSIQMLKTAGITITPEEQARFEVADFGLNELEKTGLEIITYVNTERCCAKEIVMFPHQTCPESCFRKEKRGNECFCYSSGSTTEINPTAFLYNRG